MTRAFYFVCGLLALMLILVSQSVVPVPARPGSSAAVPAETAQTAQTAAPTESDATSVAIDDLAAWPAAARR
jgi:hypothetical protein